MMQAFSVIMGKMYEEILEAQMSLVLEFLSYKYPFHKYYSKTGVHDRQTGEFIFVQP